MDQLFDSEESSSGCESGWTLYLQHSIPHDVFSWKQEHDQEHEDDNDDEEDDDMSMVSDASSGPPHFQPHQEHQEEEEEEEYFNNDDNNVFCDPPLTLVARKRQKLFKQTSFHSHRHLQDLPTASLDDTASSPLFSFSNVSIFFDFSCIAISFDSTFFNISPHNYKQHSRFVSFIRFQH